VVRPYWISYPTLGIQVQCWAVLNSIANHTGQITTTTTPAATFCAIFAPFSSASFLRPGAALHRQTMMRDDANDVIHGIVDDANEVTRGNALRGWHHF
jgi:hypothetical protein